VSDSKIPHDYFSGYRRLANTRDEIFEKECWTCKHAIGHATWWCDREGGGCKVGNKRIYWEECYIKSELTKEDYNRGDTLVGGWVGLPDERKDLKNEKN